MAHSTSLGGIAACPAISMKFTRWFVCLVVPASALLAGNPTFDTWADVLTTETMRASPTGATMSQFFTGAEQDALDRQLTPITKAYRAEQVAKAQAALAQLAKFDRARLSAEQGISATGGTGSLAAVPPTPRGGRFTPSNLPWRTMGTKAIPSAILASSTPSCSAPSAS